MNTSELAAELRASLNKLKAERSGLATQIADMVNRWAVELSPITTLMEEYGLPYGNTLITANSDRGYIIGEAFVENDVRILYIYNGLYVISIDESTGLMYGDIEKNIIELSEFVKTADLDCLYAGFDYVRNLKTTAVTQYAERNAALRGFVEGKAL